MRVELGGATSGSCDLVPLNSKSRHTALEARTMNHAQSCASTARAADQDPQPGRVDEADSGQVEQRRHSVRPCRIERRAQAVRGTPVELASAPMRQVSSSGSTVTLKSGTGLTETSSS